ncbi:MAG: choice-of-anchor L domain-containing protein [Flavobacteriaceae bacterium]|jgi:gliding motility-associated-like protein|nr:choice-of-anchor L domain-containing protein [Flavobacteriaceae bacterium]
MKNKQNRLWVLFCILSIGAFAFTLQGSFGKYRTSLEDYFKKEEVASTNTTACTAPTDLKSKDINTVDFTIYWQDAINQEWQYYVQPLGGPLPDDTKAITTQLTSNKITQDNFGNTITSNTVYEFYVKSKCATGYSEWIGPVTLQTKCSPIGTLPFTETFDTDSNNNVTPPLVQSNTIHCWTVVTAQNEYTQLSGTSKVWKLTNHEAYYTKSSGSNDWLISPTFQLQAGKLYELSYDYKTGSYDATYEVMLSQNGTDISQFTLPPLQTKTTKTSTGYVNERHYINGNLGNVNIGWHVITNDFARLYINNVVIKEVNCASPTNINIFDVGTTDAKVNFTENGNKTWEYYVTPLGAGSPSGSGSITTSNTITINRTNANGNNLQPNTNYSFYIRSNCGGGKTEAWIGPINFRTLCGPQPLPYFYGFNAQDDFNCWKVVDNNNDFDGYSRKWLPSKQEFYEGNQAMLYNHYEGPHDDYLITPSFVLDATKKYRLKYHYKTGSNRGTYSLKIAKNGAEINNFTTTLLSKKNISVNIWTEEKIVIANVGGTVNFAFHNDGGVGSSGLYVDNFFLEEITCTDPTDLKVTNIESSAATLSWTDDHGTQWEYFVQPYGRGIPKKAGTLTTNKTAQITTDYRGQVLVPNSPYDYYVRTVCANGATSDWTGPMAFTTGCSSLNLPLWEGFNSGSPTINCWTIIDGNGDVNGSGDGKWSKKDRGMYEGNGVMSFVVYDYVDAVNSDDWLITPTLKLVAGKTYRLRYRYSGSHYSSTGYKDSKFDVVASTKGTAPANFTTFLLADQDYNTSGYQQKTIFITGLSGDVNFAWHAKGKGSINLSIDDVTIEEVVGCNEPVELGADKMEKDSANLFWQDNSGGKNWEYYIQEQGKGKPATTDNGTKTSNKTTNKATKDAKGNTLKSNTDYEYYVRTDCGNGAYSIWSGPFVFTTTCAVYTIPYFDGLNTNTGLGRCWEFTKLDQSFYANVWDVIGSNMYEGDQVLKYTKYTYGNAAKGDAWAITPAIQTTTGTYVLKYHYKTDVENSNSFEVKLASKGTAPADFTTTLVAERQYKGEVYKEEVAFFNGVNGTINVGWHATSELASTIYIDNIRIEKVENCAEPYNLQVSKTTSTGFDLEWKQFGTVAAWEVIVVKGGDKPSATPILTTTVTGNPSTTITGLPSGKAYSVYVRSKCSATDTKYSDWSGANDTMTNSSANDNCSGAINLPVNATSECKQSVNGTFLGTTDSNVAIPTCNTNGMKNDVWYEFTAKATQHTLSIFNAKSLSLAKIPKITGALYDDNCTTLTATALQCFTYNVETAENYIAFNNLTIGKKYLVRLGLQNDAKQTDITYDLCLGTPSSIIVNEAGTKYTVDQLVNDILVDSNCDLVSNIKWSTGTNFGENNGIGYFNSNNTSFKFKEGIILANNGVKYAEGPNQKDQGTDTKQWPGDNDLQTLLYLNERYEGNYNATVLEFDFIPVVDSLKFDFIFASNEYGDFQCGVSDVFAFFLTDLTTDDMTNLAVVPNTNTAVSVTTIRDRKYAPTQMCGSSNEEYFDRLFGLYGELPATSPTNFTGMTVPMTAKSKVIPGRKYHIKLAIADFADPRGSSAVFLEAGSFNIGNLDLGKDLLVEDGTAICYDAPKTIKSGVDTTIEGTVISWYKDGVKIANADKPDLEVKEAGTYKVVAKYGEVKCEVTGEIKVEMFTPIHTIVQKPNTIEVCRNVIDGVQTIDLTQVEATMFKGVTKANYKTTYFVNAKDTPAVIDPTKYQSDNKTKDIFVLVEDVKTGCSTYFSFQMKAVQGTIPTKPADVVACDSYVLPATKANEKYYSQAGGKGTVFEAGAVLKTGNYTLYLLADNGNGCYEEVSFSIKITEKPRLQDVEDIEMECAYYTLPNLLANNKYFVSVNGKRTEIKAGTTIYETGTVIYVVAESPDGVCKEETSFKINYLDCPIPKGFSPNGDNINDRFDLSSHGVSSLKIFNRNGVNVYSFDRGYKNQWDGKDKSGKDLPAGTYYYVIEANGKTRTGWVEINR